MKCLKYWPHEGTCEFGRITVEVTDEEFYSDFVLRTFKVKKVCILLLSIHNWNILIFIKLQIMLIHLVTLL